jgi:hypothetical protein
MNPMNSVYFLVYASTAVKALSETELLTLLESARAFNQSRKITGLLLYASGTFVQVLEGSRSEVLELYGRILRDTRHKDCTVIAQGERLGRRFPDWTMGFKDLQSLEPSQVPGFSPILQQTLRLGQIVAEPDPVLRLLFSFAGETS